MESNIVSVTLVDTGDGLPDIGAFVTPSGAHHRYEDDDLRIARYTSGVRAGQIPGDGQGPDEADAEAYVVGEGRGRTYHACTTLVR